MAQTIRQELELPNLQNHLQQSLNVAQSDKIFLQYMQRQPIRHSVMIHRLHGIVMSEFKDQHHIDIIDKLNLFQKLQSFLRELQYNRLLEENQLSEYELTSILELLEVLLWIPKVNQQRIDKEVDTSKTILNIIYPKIEHTNNQQLLGTFVQCLYLLRKKKNDILRDVMFAELFIKTLNRSEEFLDYFCEYIGKNTKPNYEIVENLIRGLSLRLPSLVIDENYRAMILDTYTILRNFLKREPADSVWFGILLRQENMIIFDAFKLMMTKNCYHTSLAALMSEFVSLYLSADLPLYRKYEFILSFFKFVIQKAPTFFTLVESNILNEETRFLQWFVAQQLKDNDLIVLTYMANRYALEFLLILLICYMYYFPKKVDEISAKMHNIGLLDEAKYFMEYQPLQAYLRVFYHHTGEEDMYEEFLNRIQDSTISHQFK